MFRYPGEVTQIPLITYGSHDGISRTQKLTTDENSYGEKNETDDERDDTEST